ncbi:MAG: S8 family serine peptidase [Rhodobacteraceae bacterium]|nr:S8 family serine peptidase [Paracoccaceae bacterium]
MSIELLAAAQELAASEPENGLPANRLRFTLEYFESPDLEAERHKISTLLGGDNFALEPLDALLPQFLVLQFPGIERRMSPASQFAAADALVDALDLVSAVPDIGATFVIAPAESESAESESVEGAGDFFLGLTCWVKDKILPIDWAVNAMNIPPLWARGINGFGVRIAQPDTGVATHPELNGLLDLTRALNVLNGTNDPTDPLSDDMGNPGHGTATSSVVASRSAGNVLGAAPGAKVVPIRCVNSVILGIDSTALARAILHAIQVEADVISMSLGGLLYSPSLAAAMAKATDAGIIIVAAAGNCVQPIVVYPARDSNAIAIGGSNHRDKPWKGSSRGSDVAVSAPAENVLVARRTPDDGGHAVVTPSQGTSFATALTAGLAAMWVQHKGRPQIRSEAARLGVTVNQLYKSVLRQTARRPSGWPSSLGTGIVDGEAVIDFDLASIQSISTPESVEPISDDDLVAALDASFDGIGTGFDDWPRIGAETIFLLSDAWIRAERGAGLPVESPSRPSPSRGLSTRLPEDIAAALAPAADTPDFNPPMVAREIKQPNYAKLLAAGAPGTSESSAVMSDEQAKSRLKSDGADKVLVQAAKAFTAISSKGLGERDAQANVLQQARQVIQQVADGNLDQLDTAGRTTLEALVQITDRPAYRVTDGTIDPDDPLFGEWGGFLSLLVDLPKWANSVGRINLGGTHVGTGFLMGGGQIMTNRHVLEACADEVVGPGGAVWRFDRGEVTIDFSDLADGSKEQLIGGVSLAGPDPIRGMENLLHLDAAILSLAPGATGLPRELPFAQQVDTDADMMTIGYPARPGTSAFIDPATGKPSHEVARRLRQIFGTDYGRKYVAPGRVLEGPGQLAGDPNDWALSHDCTTLGGNSGSVVIQIDATPAVSGLHFSGAPLTANKAHALGRVDRSPIGPLPGAIWI